MKDELDYPDHAPTTRKMLYGAILSIVAMPAFITLLMVTVAHKESIDNFCNGVVMFIAKQTDVQWGIIISAAILLVYLIIKSAKRG